MFQPLPQQEQNLSKQIAKAPHAAAWILYHCFLLQRSQQSYVAQSRFLFGFSELQVKSI